MPIRRHKSIATNAPRHHAKRPAGRAPAFKTRLHISTADIDIEEKDAARTAILIFCRHWPRRILTGLLSKNMMRASLFRIYRMP